MKTKAPPQGFLSEKQWSTRWRMDIERTRDLLEKGLVTGTVTLLWIPKKRGSAIVVPHYAAV